MNTEILEYALEIAKYKSINKAAEALYISQSNLSRDIKKLEESVGYKIFNRTNKGIEVTKEGEVFLSHASTIVNSFNAIHNVSSDSYQQIFSIAVPKATYIAKSFRTFVDQLNKKDKMLISFKETSSVGAIDEITLNGFKLGIIRYQKQFEPLVLPALELRGLIHHDIKNFEYVVAFSKDDALAQKEEVTIDDIKDYIEITHGDPYIPNFSMNTIDAELVSTNKKIKIYDSMGQLKLLSDVRNSFMIVYPLEEETLNNYGLVQRRVAGLSNACVDVLIYRKDYNFTYLDNIFLDILKEHLK